LKIARMVSVRAPVLANSRLTGVPMAQPFSAAVFASTAMEPASSASRLPAETSRSTISPAVRGSTAETNVVFPSTFAWPMRKPVTARTSGSLATSAASVGDRPPNPNVSLSTT
jgi:hypothetical protein